MRWMVALTLLLLCGCNSTTPATRGHLIIAGGAVRPENDRIYGAFFGPLAPDAVIGVVPTASASAAESAESSARTLTRHAAGRRIVKLDLPSGQPEKASDPAVVLALRECSALWFTGGVQSRILATFRPGSGDTPAFAAARDILSRGGAIGGTSAGAAMMSDPMIAGGNSEDALSGNFRTDDEDSGLGITKGMGFFPYGLVDQHFLRRGRIGRLIIALERTGLARGYGVEENSAIDADLERGMITAIGSIVLVDVAGMKRDGQSLRGVRVSLLRDGDTVDARTGDVSPLGKRLDIPPEISGPGTLPAAWSAGAIEIALQRLASKPNAAAELESPGYALQLRTDAQTTVWEHEGRLTTVRAIFDVSPRAKPQPNGGNP